MKGFTNYSTLRIAGGIALAAVAVYAGYARMSGIRDGEKKRFEANTKQDLKIIKVAFEFSSMTNKNNINEKSDEIEGYASLQGFVDRLSLKVRSGSDKMLDYAGRNYLVKKSDSKLVIWSVGFNGINELGGGDDLVEIVQLNR